MDEHDDQAIAIIGMAGRFPGAHGIDQFWELLKGGREALSHLSDQELRNSGVSEALMNDARYVKAWMKFEGADLFDAAFFGYSPRQAVSLDPQGRIFLECAWEALESAAYDVDRYDGSIGIFAGCGVNRYFIENISDIIRLNSGDWHQCQLDAEKDFLTTRASYKLDLRGPSVAVQTACSTSLVAVHLACQSLLSFESDMALAGGVSVKPTADMGYLYQEGGIAARDGHCRPFDAAGQGTLSGSGVAIVVLKRIAEALRDRNEIHAVIRGSAINNDGSAKVGYTAPGIPAQAKLIATALAIAGVEPRDIGLVEGHGTGTVLGDAVELTALTQAFQARTRDAGFCALGSVKSNIGHLDTAAGAAGLIKAVLCLKNKAFVPSLNFQEPNAILKAPDSPFYVNTVLRPWQTESGRPRRAGISAFGMGGTNAHVVLEEAPTQSRQEHVDKEHIFPFSARSEKALRAVAANLAAALEGNSNSRLADVAYTLQVGRKRFNQRACIVASNREQLIAGLRDSAPSIARVDSSYSECPVIFMFPGQGSQRLAGFADLYASDDVFRREMDSCAERFASHMKVDVRKLLFGAGTSKPADLTSTLFAQPAIFTIEYSLAQRWMSWGVQPRAMIGHSVGEYVAACVAGAFSLEDAVRLIATRSRLMDALPRGGMVAVQLSQSDAEAIISSDLSIAAVNAPAQCVISGPIEPLEELTTLLAQRNITFHRLEVSHAFHSGMMDPAVDALAEAASRIRLQAPTIPFVSCVTGGFATNEQVTNPLYWGSQLRRPVQFAAGLKAVGHERGSIFLEVSPGRTLIDLARRQIERDKDAVFLTSSMESTGDRHTLLSALGGLWLHGATIDWPRLHDDDPRRVMLPTYPFERQRYWISDWSDKKSVSQDSSAGARASATDGVIATRQAGVFPAAELQRSAAHQEPRTDLERAIVNVWEEVLGIKGIGVSDNFLDLGGDSLIGLRVAARLRELFHVQISPKLLIGSHSTVAALAVEIVSRLAELQEDTVMREQLEAVEK